MQKLIVSLKLSRYRPRSCFEPHRRAARPSRPSRTTPAMMRADASTQRRSITYVIATKPTIAFARVITSAIETLRTHSIPHLPGRGRPRPPAGASGGGFTGTPGSPRKIGRAPDGGPAARPGPPAGETMPAPIARCGSRKKKRTPRKARPKGIVRNMRTIRSRTRTAAAIPAIATRGPSTIAGGAPRAITPDGTAGFDKAVSGNPSGRPKPLSGGSSLARPGQERLGPPRPQVRSLDARPPPRAEARTVPSREGDPDEVPAEGGRGRRGHRERARVLDDPDGGAPLALGAGVRRGRS